jgi:ParB-like chromosome segregation protein Spo0J
MNIRDISLAKLVPSPANVRRTGASIGIDELAASIAAHGLLQNPQVRPGPKGKLVKRQMYGRAKLDLLEARLIGAA